MNLEVFVADRPVKFVLQKRVRIPFLVVLSIVLVVFQNQGHAQSPGKTDILFREIEKQKLYLDLFTPRNPPPASGYPLIVSIHGGAWKYGDRHDDAMLRGLTNRGFALASIDYRLCDEAKYPAQIDDVKEAVRWLVENAGPYSLDTNRIFAIGFSAGGHLSLLLGLSQKSGDHIVKAVCAFYPPTDLVGIVPPSMRNQTNNPIADLLGGPVSEKLVLARQASPITYIRKDSVPVLIYHGDADTLVPLGQSKSFDAAMKAAGAKCSLMVYHNQGHGFAPGDDALFQIAKFFQNSVKE